MNDYSQIVINLSEERIASISQEVVRRFELEFKEALRNLARDLGRAKTDMDTLDALDRFFNVWLGGLRREQAMITRTCAKCGNEFEVHSGSREQYCERCRT